MMIALKRKRQLANQLTQRINEVKEDQLRIAVSDFFRKQRNLVLAAFDEYYLEEMLLQGHIDLILAPIHELQKEYYELLLEHNRDMFHRGEAQAERLVDNAKRQYSMKSKKTVDFLHDNENKYTQHFGTLQFSEDYLEQYTFTATEKTMQRVDSEINQILTDGYKEGWGVRDVKNRILQRYDQFETWEANRIARTEMQTAHNMGMMNKYQELGVEYKEWRAAHDLRTRKSHIDMDGEIAPLDEPFSNGLMFPGDKSGRIEEWINCRCSYPPFIMPPGMMAPPGMSTFKVSDLVSVTEPNYGKLLQKETGGALNWQQYKQVLHGKPLEQVLTGLTVAEAQQQREEKPKPKAVDNTPYQLNNRENSFSEVKITQEQFENVIAHQSKRENVKLEFGNSIDNATGNLIHSKDIRGKKNTVKIPTSNRPYSVLHNHTNDGGFSGGDAYSHLMGRHQEVCYATTPKGVWVMRDTSQATFSKKEGLLTENSATELKYKMEGKYRELAKESKEKYQSQYHNAKTKEEKEKVRQQLNNEVFTNYNNWLLEEFAVGKRRDWLIEIEFIPKEKLKDVQF